MNPNQLQAQLLLQNGLMSQSQIEALYQQLAQYSDQDLISLSQHSGCIDPQTAQTLRQQQQHLESSYESSRLPSMAQSAEPSSPEHDIVHSVKEVLKDNEWFKPTGELCWLQKELLGEGGMGAVFRVQDICLGRDAALKIMHSEDEANLSRFKREVIITAKLDHPSIPPVYEAGRTADGVHYMVMKIVEGDTLKDRIAQVHKDDADPASIRELLQSLIKVGEALCLAHANGIVHRDLKPENIMLGEHGEVFVMDWGIARDLNATINSASEELLGQSLSLEEMNKAGVTVTGVLIGTPGYMSPEQIDGFCTEKNDIFALGVILTEILTGARSIEGDTLVERIACTVSGKAKTPRQIDRRCPRELESLAQAALEAEQEQRLDSARDFVENLNAYLSGHALPIHQYSVRERLIRWSARHPTRILSIAAAFVFFSAAALAFQAFKKSEEEKNDALTSAKKAKANEKQTKDALRRLEEAELLVSREAPKGKVWEVIKDALLAAGDDYTFTLRAASICKEAGLIEQAEELLIDATKTQKKAYEALFMLHDLEMLRHPHANFVYTKPAQELARRAKKFGDENEITIIITAIDLYSRNQLDDALAAISKIEKYSTKIGYGYYILGMIQTRLRQFENAKTNFDLAIKKDPLLANAYNSRGTLHIRKADYRKALADFNIALKINPRFVLAYSNRSQAFLNMGQTKLGLNDVNAAIRLDPGHAQSYANRAVIRAQLKDKSGTRADLDEAIRLDPSHSLAYINRAILRHDNGQKQEALSDLALALKHDPKNALAHAFQGRLNMEKRDYEAALKDFGRAIEFDPRNGNAYRLRAMIRRGRGDISGAIDDYSNALRSNAFDTTSYVNRGVLLKGRGQIKEAMADFNRAIQIDKKIPAAYVNRGTLYKLQKQWKRAFADYQQALQLKPTDASNYKNCGVIKYSMGDMKSAEAYFSEAIKRDPQFSEYYNMRAAAREKLGNSRGALEDLNSAIRTKRDNGQAYLNRAFLKQRLKDNSGALRDYTEGLKYRPKSAISYQRRAMLYQELKQYKNALADFNTVLKLEPNNASAFASRAVVKMRLGRYKEGALDYERYLRLKPNSPKANQMRAVIKQELKRPSKY